MRDGKGSSGYGIRVSEKLRVKRERGGHLARGRRGGHLSGIVKESQPAFATNYLSTCPTNYGELKGESRRTKGGRGKLEASGGRRGGKGGRKEGKEGNGAKGGRGGNETGEEREVIFSGGECLTGGGDGTIVPSSTGSPHLLVT